MLFTIIFQAHLCGVERRGKQNLFTQVCTDLSTLNSQVESQ
jgi:hypothetical protein